MTSALLVALGAALGAPVRYLTSHLLRTRWGARASAGTLTVNVLGSFLLGLLAADGVAGDLWALVGIGFCGALTTFSSLTLELWEAYAEGRRREGLVNLTLSLVLGLGAAWLGWSLGS